uniref:Uncharacterized protein n=1 Tax=Arundo donax TaxID=35708 RepID=A0A0A9G6W9_ARUDO
MLSEARKAKMCRQLLLTFFEKSRGILQGIQPLDDEMEMNSNDYCFNIITRAANRTSGLLFCCLSADQYGLRFWALPCP